MIYSFDTIAAINPPLRLYFALTLNGFYGFSAFYHVFACGGAGY